MQLIRRLNNLSIRKKYICAYGLGAFMALSQAPFYFFPAIIIGFTGLLFLEGAPRRRSLKQSFWLGGLFGLGYYMAGLYWIAFALGVEIEAFWWLVPFTVVGVPAFLAFWSGLALLITRYAKLEGAAKIFLFAALWAAGEWARGNFLTGFPWNLVGYTWIFSIEIVQSVSVIGIYGLSALTILLGCVPYLILKNKRYGDACIIAALFIGMAGYGALRLKQAPTAFHENLTLRIVQPNIAQTLKWNSHSILENYNKILHLSNLPSHRKITHVLWPESALPFYLEEDAWRREEIMKALPPGSILLTGGLRRQFDKENLTHIWNSLLMIGPDFNVLAAYDKAHLVPFGEYIPLRKWLPDLIKKVSYGSIDFSAGVGPQTIQAGPHTPPFSPLICYEGIFPGRVTNAARPEWMVNVTNDAWYGATSGPYQHFGIIRVRAIEEGLPMARVANTGISGIFDPYGRVLSSLDLNSEGIIDSRLPLPLSTPPLYTRYREGIFGLILILMALRALFSHKVTSFNLRTRIMSESNEQL